MEDGRGKSRQALWKCCAAPYPVSALYYISCDTLCPRGTDKRIYTHAQRFFSARVYVLAARRRCYGIEGWYTIAIYRVFWYLHIR